MKHLLALVAVIVLAVAPAAMRLGDSHPKWVLVRLGARPVEDDPSREKAVAVKRLLELADRIDPVHLVFGILCLLSLLSLLAPYARAVGRVDGSVGPLAESGLCAGWSSRAPPLA